MNKGLLIFFLAAFAALSLSALAQSNSKPRDLTEYRGKNRLLLVFAPSRTDSRRQAQDTLLKDSAAALRDRDLLWFDFPDAGSAAEEAARRRYHIQPDQFRVLLIGKDGHVASSSAKPMSLGELSAQIDRMPMRRDEMRRKEKQRGR